MSIAPFNKWNELNTAEQAEQAEQDKKRYLDCLGSGGIWTVKFDKVDGTHAVMDVTLDPQIMPPSLIAEGKEPRLEKPHLIHAYSTDRDGWRSFTVANVKSFYQK